MDAALRDKALLALRDLETAYQNTVATAKVMTRLLAYDALTCEDARKYNVLAMSIWNQQVGVLQIFRAAGATALPETPPFPMLFALAGKQGMDALQIDCSALPKFVGAAHLQIVTSPTSVFANDGQAFIKFVDASTGAELRGELGALPVLAYMAIIVGVGISAYFTEKAIEAWSADSRAVDIAAMDFHGYEVETAQHRWDNELRDEAFFRCLKDKTDVTNINACAGAADKIVKDTPKRPNFRDYLNKNKLGGDGIIWWVGAAACVSLLTLGGAWLYRRRKTQRAMLYAGRAAAPTRRHHSADDTMVDEDNA